MDFKNIPVDRHPAYTWLWNTAATREIIKKQIDEMFDAGIRAFYILGEPERFRPTVRRTHLSPEYLSNEYIDLVYYAFEVAKKKGMYTWLYNEGGYPSGTACGKILDLRPDLIQRNVVAKEYTLKASVPYKKSSETLVSFRNGVRLNEGDTFSEDAQITDFCNSPASTTIQSDIARKENVELFLKLTHDAFKVRFGEAMGRDVTMMFDDEAHMGQWSDGLDSIFLDKYGYDLLDYLPYVIDSPEYPPKTDKQRRAKIDYIMLCGELVCNNYFGKMKDWLNKNGMLSVGHLDLDHCAAQSRIRKYGNSLKLLRQFDVPGIDAIWSQISYPDENGVCCHDRFRQANEFFPRLASSAANQQGHSRALSESFAVYGSHVTPEEMRYVVNYQAVRGISLYNFMAVSLDRKSTLCYQFRPNFIPENTGMDTLGEINEYTARISHILQSSRPDITTALYYPQRTILASGEFEAEATSSYMNLGNMLERAGVSFDIIDEELVLEGEVCDGALVCDYVTYKNILVPAGAYELPEVLEKLSHVGKEINPCIKRKNEKIIARKLLFEDDDEGYFIVNTDGKTIEDTVTVVSELTPYEIDLNSGEIYKLPFERNDGEITFEVNLLRGEAMMVFLSAKELETAERIMPGEATELTFVRAYINREYSVEDGPQNAYFSDGERPMGLGKWDKHFSGEVTYIFRADNIVDGDYILDLGEVRYFARFWVNEKKAEDKIMPPYRICLNGLRQGDEIKVRIANTIANVCHDAALFEKAPDYYVGPYHKHMVIAEKEAPAGGLLGNVRLLKPRKYS